MGLPPENEKRQGSTESVLPCFRQQVNQTVSMGGSVADHFAPHLLALSIVRRGTRLELNIGTIRQIPDPSAVYVVDLVVISDTIIGWVAAVSRGTKKDLRPLGSLFFNSRIVSRLITIDPTTVSHL